jgi:hypothetical protein
MTDEPSATATEGTVSDPAPPTSARAERFLADAEALHVPTSIATTERRVLVVGALLVAGGFAAIIAGYWGASGTAKIYEEIPYLISGGIFGIALVVVGAFLVARYSTAKLLRFWLARLSAEHQLQTDRLIAAVERLEARADR